MLICNEAPKSLEEILKKLTGYSSHVCPNLATAILILLTLSSSVVSCERSFSKLKLVKNYLRSTMAQERLSSLALMSVESTVLDATNMNDIISSFAAKKGRKISYPITIGPLRIIIRP